MGAPTSPVWYFAYGSNMQTTTFRDRRGVPFSRALPARVSGWRIVFDKPPVVPGGAAVANIVADPAAVVFGVLYEITPEDLAHVELTEGVLIGNYHRVEVKAESLGAAVLATTAASVASDLHDSTRVPSDRYMGCVIAGRSTACPPRTSATCAGSRYAPRPKACASCSTGCSGGSVPAADPRHATLHGCNVILRRKYRVWPHGKSSSAAKTS